MTAFSPITRPLARMSPSTLPSICTSPFETSVPRTISSALMTDGAPARPTGRLGATVVAAGTGCGWATGASVWGCDCGCSLVFENMLTYLDELGGISYGVVEPHL